MIALHCDGSLKLDKGYYGGIIRDNKGEPILAYAGIGHFASVLHMELLAIFRGITLCIEKNFTKVSIKLDSKLVVDMLNGVIQGPWDTQVIKRRILQLTKYFALIEFKHVWRELNRPADYMASLELPSEEILIMPTRFPNDLKVFVEEDAAHMVYYRV
ncbi:uncharacterized protein LOC122094776 [Macadamia integrifolia]|uniref:uncharacterized protein LOC122094776 n=1 Tax=Macadamia integrifolia TaxID=60698 RepID=UPI001C532A03|nr:uncharacterized protein LOC122094776 [Macadamia integrifolia]